MDRPARSIVGLDHLNETDSDLHGAAKDCVVRSRRAFSSPTHPLCAVADVVLLQRRSTTLSSCARRVRPSPPPALVPLPRSPRSRPPLLAVTHGYLPALEFESDILWRFQDKDDADDEEFYATKFAAAWAHTSGSRAAVGSKGGGQGKYDEAPRRKDGEWGRRVREYVEKRRAACARVEKVRPSLARLVSRLPSQAALLTWWLDFLAGGRGALRRTR